MEMKAEAIVSCPNLRTIWCHSHLSGVELEEQFGFVQVIVVAGQMSEEDV